MGKLREYAQANRRTHRVAVLEEALRFYADEKKYILLIKDKKAMEKFTDKYGDSVEADHGEMARKALEGK
jgi:hypothetical protein